MRKTVTAGCMHMREQPHGGLYPIQHMCSEELHDQPSVK